MPDLLVFDSPVTGGVTYNLGALTAAAAATGPGQTATERVRAGVDITVDTAGPARVRGLDPLPVAGWCDGIQNSTVAAWHDGRPVIAAYLAAGASDGRRPAALVGLCEQINLYGAEDDPDAELLSAATGVPLTALPASDRTRLAALAANRISDDRARLERRLAEQLLTADPASRWVIDGSLAHMPEDRRLVGVVKTHAARYLPDETELFTLPAGYRSSVFTFTHRRRSDDEEEGVRVWSAYVRLHRIPNAAWDAGLIRVETTHPDDVDAAAALVYGHAQNPAASVRDGRWDRHLDPVAWCEKLLRDRRPILFERL